MLVSAYRQRPATAFVSTLFCFFKWVPPDIVPRNQPAVLTPWEFCFRHGWRDQTRFHVGDIDTFRGSTFLFTDDILYFFFLLWWQLCIPKQASFWRTPMKVAFWRRWRFYMSLVMLLYSCTFILPYMLFLSLAIDGAYSIRRQSC